MKKNKETKKLKEGEEVIFSDGKTLMEKVTVESIDKKGGFAVLSNKVKVPRTLGPDGFYTRLDGKSSMILPLTDKSELDYQAFKSYFSIKRNLEFIEAKIKDMKDKEFSELIVELDKKISKIVNKYFEQ
ncbi:MAG: hypothetical protein [Bacteriophage sp.]|nr:MAG: hypothetical protein [Bacteriophage sp.]